ncbi:MAG TPA: hypothetical protein P5026_13015 [Kiritimatiellia bacterium]|nr:hypothetical protein [Kiritimatiellia bacterium]HRU71118.1 hypothetical protein [Kiritimatiellia bacterium]
MALLMVILPLLLAAGLPEEARLMNTCEVLQRTPLSATDLQILAEYARSDANSPALQSRAMAAYAIALLLQGDSNRFVRAQQIHQTTYPGDAQLIPITAKEYSVACDACGGTGQREKAVCPGCFGRGTLFQLSPVVAETYRERLREIVALCRENAEYAEKYQEAVKESRDEMRIDLLQTLTNRYAHRKDLAPAIALLNDALAKRDARLREEQAKEARQRAEREVEALKTLAQDPDRSRAIRELRAYLAAHPQASAALELQTLLDELVAKEKQRELLRQIGIGTGVLMGLLCLTPLARFCLFRRRVTVSGPLPGMEKIDKSRFTDPLSLTAQDSQARVKRNTARIPVDQSSR